MRGSESQFYEKSDDRSKYFLLIVVIIVAAILLFSILKEKNNKYEESNCLINFIDGNESEISENQSYVTDDSI